MGETHGFEEDQIRRISENLQFGGRLDMAINEKKAYAAYYDNDIRIKALQVQFFLYWQIRFLKKKELFMELQ